MLRFGAARLLMRRTAGSRPMSSIQMAGGQRYPNSLEWVKAGCPSPIAEVGSSPSSLTASAADVAQEVPKLINFILDGPFIQFVFGVAAVYQLGKAMTFNPLKHDSDMIMVDGRWEVKPEAEEGGGYFRKTG